MQGNRQNQKNYPQQRDNNRFDQKQCHLGWNCDKVLQNKCKFKHDPNDKQDIKALNKIKKNKIIIIAETHYNDIRPICLFEKFLPIKLIPNQKIKIEVGKYYVGFFVSAQNRCAILEVEICIGSFGQWKIERRIFQSHLPPLFEALKSKENFKEKRGKINVNGALQKVLLGEQNLREYFQKVNQKSKYPLFEGCEVSYIEKNKTIQITRIRYPEYQKFSGILQIDNSSQFYFIARSETYDQMNPYRIPEQLAVLLKECNHSLPYTILKSKPLNRQVQDKINKMLKEYLVRGQFEQWPHESNYPIIALENQVQKRTFQSQKQGIIYETGIAIKSFTKNEKKQSDKILNKLKMKDFEKKRKLFKGKIFTVDNKNTKCHDDAIQIEQNQEGEFKVKIHIADIAEVIKSSSSLDKSMKDRDSTLYIRDYFQPMIHYTLRNKFSLKSGDPKLALTLSFKVSKCGQLDFSTVRFINSIIQVEENLSHQRLEKEAQKYPELFRLSECLGKGDLLKQSSLIQYGSKSEFCMSRMIELSAIIPTVMLQLNIEKTKEFKKKFDGYIKKVIEEKQKQMQAWENEVEKVNKVRKQLKLNENKEKKLKNQINKEITKEKEKLLKKIKQQIKAKFQQENKQKKQKTKISKDRNIVQGQSSQFTDQQSEAEEFQEGVSSIGIMEPIQMEEIFEDFNEILLKEKEKRANALKEMKNKENFTDQSQTQSQFSQYDSEEDLDFNQGYKMTKAMGGKRFLQKIFSYFNINLEWLRESQINDAFKKILSMDKGKLYQEYFKRIQITNRQHFHYIVETAKKQKRQNDRKSGKQPQENAGRREGRREGKNRVQDKREDKKQDEKKQLKNQQAQQEILSENKNRREGRTRIQNKEDKKKDEKKQLKQKEIKKKQANNAYQARRKYQSKKVNQQEIDISQSIKVKNQESSSFNNQKKVSDNKIAAEEIQLQQMKNRMSGISKNSSFLEQNQKMPLNKQQKMVQDIQQPQMRQLLPPMGKDLFSGSNFIMRPMQMMGIKPPSMIFPNMKPELQQIMPINFSQNSTITMMGPPKMGAMPKYGPSSNIIPTNSDYTNSRGNKIKKERSIKPISIKQPKTQSDSLNRKFEEDFNKIQNKLRNKGKPILSDEYKDKFKEMVLNLNNNIKQVEEKYYDLIKNGNKLEIFYSEEQQKLFEENSLDFRKQYEFLKRRTIINVNRIIKKQKKIDLRGMKQISENINSGQDSQLQLSEDEEKVKPKKKDIKKKQQINKPPNIQQNKIENEKTSKEEKDQMNVQAIVQVKASTKAQIFVQIKASNQLCQKVIEETRLKTVQQQISTKIQQSQEAQPSQSRSPINQPKNQNNNKDISHDDLIKETVKQLNPPIAVPNKQPAKKSKKQINKMVQQLMKPISEQIKLKYTEQLKQIEQEIKKLKTLEKDTGKLLKLELQKSTIHFNLIRLIAHQETNKKKDQSQEQSQSQNDEENTRGKNKKNKKKNKKNKKSSTKKSSKNIFQQILQNFYSYADKSGYDFSIMDDEELDELLKKQLGFESISEKENYSLEKINAEAAKMAAENMTLKWNNPIRSYESLMVMRLIKQHYWLFQGNIFPTQIVLFGDQLKQLDKKLKKLKQYRQDKIANGQNDKKVKQANRQIDYLEFYYKLKKNPDRVFNFLNITSSTPRIKRVFHEILGEVELENTKFVQEMYKEVKGKVKIVEDFPIKLKIQIIQ